MGKIDKISFENQSEEIKDKVQAFWTKRADSFYEQRMDEIESNKAERWLKEISAFIPEGRKLRILDVGCGTGFFEVILGREGHEIIGIDLTEEMIMKAKLLIMCNGLNQQDVKAVQMDAEKLDFEDESFDMVITRNLTWTLPHPITAYKEWKRVLKPGGILLNFDAEYAKNAHTNLYNPENLAHKCVSTDLKDECHEIYHMLTVSTLDRPAWDLEILKQIGYSKAEADLDFGDRVYIEKDQFYMLDKMFRIMAVK